MTVLSYDDPIVQFARRARLGKAGSNAWKVAMIEANIPRANLGASWETLDASHDLDAFAAARGYADALDSLPDLVTITPNYASALADLDALIDNDKRRGLVLMGAPGNGKTSIAVAVARQYAQATQGRPSIKFAHFNDLLESVKVTWGEDQEKMSIVDLVRGCDLLLLDDLGQQRVTEWSAGQVRELLQYLWGEDRQCVITTNFDLAGLSETLGSDASMSRLLGHCTVAQLTGYDRRMARKGT
jgi:DNA replication protein DnaC